VSRVEWSRRTPDEVEAVIGYMLCREFPNAIRIKSSQGDGGIDVRVPRGNGIDVYQVKSFTGTINSSRKRLIKGSFKALLAFAEEERLRISEWFLVMPENPTKEQFKWLEQITSAADFPCSWRGLDFVEGLAAKYPEVIDYYLHSGKDRLEETVGRFLSLAGRTNPAQPPAASQQTLEDLYEALNEFDPHYRYDFSVGAVGSEGDRPPVPEPPGTVCSIQMMSQGRCVTYHIIARCNEALKERPVPGGMTLAAEVGTELQKTIADWIKFGTPMENVPAQKVHFDLPGGFTTPEGEVLVTIKPSAPQPGATPEVTLRTLDSDGETVAELDFVIEEAAAGIERRGVWAVGHDRVAGAIRYEHRAHQDDKVSTMNLSAEDFAGRPPPDLLPVLRFLNSVHPPLRLQVSVRNGPAIGAPAPIVKSLMAEDKGRLLISICENLSSIQQHVLERILFPDLCRHTWEDIEGWDRAATLLRGEQIDVTWDEIPLHLHPAHTMPPVVQTGALTSPLTVRIGDKSYELGTMIVQMATIRVDESRSSMAHGDHSDVWLVPGDDNSAVMRLVSSDAQSVTVTQPPSASHRAQNRRHRRQPRAKGPSSA
jgi:hypothetical protein